MTDLTNLSSPLINGGNTDAQIAKNIMSKIIVGVLTPFKNEFEKWVNENQKPDEEYHHIDSSFSVIGRMFDRLDYAKGALLLPKLTIQNAKYRVKNGSTEG